MLYLKAKLVKINSGERNFLVFAGSYYSKMLGTEIPSPVSVMVDSEHLAHLASLQSKLGTVIEVPVKPVYSAKNGKIFYVTNFN